VLAGIARRALLGTGVLAAVSYASFVFFTTKFGNPGPGAVAFASGPRQASARWWHFLAQIVQGDLSSLGSDRAYTWRAFGHTAALLGLTGVLVVVFALAIGVIAATRAGTVVDVVLRTVSYVAWGIPAFVLAILVWSTTGIEGWPGECGIFGVPGVLTCTPTHASATAFVEHLGLPSVALAVSFIGLHARYLRSSLLVSLHAQYTTTARAKGLPEHAVIIRHALRNSLATFLSAVFLDFGAIFGAALAVDYVFRLDGVGTLFLYEISAFGEFGIVHFYSVTFLLTLTAAFVLIASFIAEAAIAWLDPRARP
jgi:peptide/nickel transport system permease protein